MSDDIIEVPPPNRPMLVARALIGARFQTTDGQLVLRNHRGDFYRWDGMCFPEVDLRDIRRAAYEYLEHGEYLDDDKKRLRPFAPTRRKIEKVRPKITTFLHDF